MGAPGARTRSARNAKRPCAAHQAEGSRRARRRLARHRYSELVTSQEEDDDGASEADSELAEAVRLLTTLSFLDALLHILWGLTVF